MAAVVTYAMEYVRASSIDEALRFVVAGGARLVGGGTDVILHPDPIITRLVDLSDLGLDYVTEEPAGLRVGAMTTLATMLEHPALAGVAGGVVPAMMRQVGSPLLRNIATIGGHLARGRLSDVVPVLLALDARVLFTDGSQREMLLDEFYDAGLPERPFLLEWVFIPTSAPGTTAAFIKFARTGFDLAMLNAACAVTPADGAVADARIVVGETPRLATRLGAAEDALQGQELDPATIEATAQIAAETVQVGSDQRASARYRRHLAHVAVVRCLEDIARRIGADQ